MLVLNRIPKQKGELRANSRKRVLLAPRTLAFHRLELLWESHQNAAPQLESRIGGWRRKEAWDLWTAAEVKQRLGSRKRPLWVGGYCRHRSSTVGQDNRVMLFFLNTAVLINLYLGFPLPFHSGVSKVSQD